MASKVISTIRTLLKGEKTPDVEQRPVQAQVVGGTFSSTSSGDVLDISRRGTLVGNDDPIGTFRLLVGITSHPTLGYSTATGAAVERAAPNIGIYTRVVHNEAKAKQMFKAMSLTVNSCLALQIIVAAALTAMGAGQAAYSAITAFGAINTVIAGFLTYLKGSGYPNKFKYKQNEWKRIREFIDQKERDLTREGCTENVHELINTIVHMYEETKAEIDASDSDQFGSSGGAGAASKRASHIQSLSTLAPDRFSSTLRHGQDTLNEKVGATRSAFDDRHAALQSEYDARRAAAADKMRSYEDKGNEFGHKIQEFEQKYGDKVKEIAESVGQRFRDVGKDVGAHRDQVEAASRDVHNYARDRMSQITLQSPVSFAEEEKKPKEPGH